MVVYIDLLFLTTWGIRSLSITFIMYLDVPAGYSKDPFSICLPSFIFYIITYVYNELFSYRRCVKSLWTSFLIFHDTRCFNFPLIYTFLLVLICSVKKMCNWLEFLSFNSCYYFPLSRCLAIRCFNLFNYFGCFVSFRMILVEKNHTRPI